MPVDLNKKNVDIEAVAKKAIKDDKLLAELLGNLREKNEKIRDNSHKVLFHITEQHPKRLYPHWNYLVEFLDSDNTYHKLSAVFLLANLTRIDGKNRFEKIFDKYYGLLDDKSFITASYVCSASGMIAKARPKLQAKITNRLLNIDKTHHQQERKDLVKAAIIETFQEYYEQSKSKKRIVDFVRNQLNCQSPRTRKAAKEFLKRIDVK